MRQFVINELSAKEAEKVDSFLKENAQPGAITGMFWLPVEKNMLAAPQHGHDECGPFVFGIEMGEDYASFELLVRSKENLHCSCTSYPSKEQRQFLLDFFDKMIETTGVKS